MFSSEHKEHYKKTILLAIPVCLSNLGHILVGVVDTALVGKLGSVEQAGVALACSLFYLILVFGIGVSNGVTPLVAAADGENNTQTISQLLKNCIAINGVMGIFLFCLVFILSPSLGSFDQEKEVVDIAIPFLNIMGLSMIPLSIFFALKQFTEGLSLTFMAMVVSVIGNILNIILNYILIFGYCGVEPMGVMGSCWASFYSRVIMALMMVGYFLYSKKFEAYRSGFNLRGLSSALCKKILRIGVPSGLQMVFEIGAFGFAIIMIGWLGSEYQAAHQIALSLAACTFMIVSGIASAASVRVGNYYGSANKTQMRMAGFSALLMGLIFMMITATLFFSFNNFLPTFFSNSSSVIEIASGLLLIAALFQLADGTQVIALGVLRGVGDVTIPTIITLVAYWIIGLPCSYLLAFTFELGINGVWYGLTLALFIVSAFSIIRFNHISKK